MEKLCKICDKVINNTFNKNRNTHKECKLSQPYRASEKGEQPFKRK